jgi:hypothetical protein
MFFGTFFFGVFSSSIERRNIFGCYEERKNCFEKDLKKNKLGMIAIDGWFLFQQKMNNLM